MSCSRSSAQTNHVNGGHFHLLPFKPSSSLRSLFLTFFPSFLLLHVKVWWFRIVIETETDFAIEKWTWRTQLTQETFSLSWIRKTEKLKCVCFSSSWKPVVVFPSPKTSCPFECETNSNHLWPCIKPNFCPMHSISRTSKLQSYHSFLSLSIIAPSNKNSV